MSVIAPDLHYIPGVSIASASVGLCFELSLLCDSIASSSFFGSHKSTKVLLGRRTDSSHTDAGFASVRCVGCSQCPFNGALLASDLFLPPVSLASVTRL